MTDIKSRLVDGMRGQGIRLPDGDWLRLDDNNLTLIAERLLRTAVAVQAHRVTPYYSGARTLYHGDALNVASTLEDGAADCIVTSPPYFGLRDYGIEGRTGSNRPPLNTSNPCARCSPNSVSPG
jgi:hypothetical protein